MWWLYHLWGKYRSFSVDYFVIFCRFIDCKDTHFFLNGKNYLNVLIWEFVNVGMCERGNVLMWECGNVGMCLCGNVGMRECGNA